MNIKVEGQDSFDYVKYSLPKINLNEAPFRYHA